MRRLSYSLRVAVATAFIFSVILKDAPSAQAQEGGVRTPMKNADHIVAGQGRGCHGPSAMSGDGSAKR